MKFVISLISWVQSSFFLRFIGVRAERRNAFLESRFFESQPCKESVTWFHAASLGELEMLIPLIEDFHARGLKVGVSAFSDSALSGLRRLKSFAVFSDLSPREDEWKRLFDRFNVNKLILAKYDFWPGLLQAAAQRGAPVLVINAQMRRSLLRVKTLFRIFGESFPKMILFANDVVSIGELKINLHTSVPIIAAADPRWERVARRKEIQKPTPALYNWSEKIRKMPRPMGVIGSAWTSDLEKILPPLQAKSDSIVIVPHDLSEENLYSIQVLIEENNLSTRAVVVTEMGILVELYALADWAFVGGGFGKGIHSLLEPISYSIPVACGPQKFRDFPETRELSQLGFVTRCESTESFAHWLKDKSTIHFDQNFIGKKRVAYRELLEKCLEIRGTNP